MDNKNNKWKNPQTIQTMERNIKSYTFPRFLDPMVNRTNLPFKYRLLKTFIEKSLNSFANIYLLVFIYLFACTNSMMAALFYFYFK